MMKIKYFIAALLSVAILSLSVQSMAFAQGADGGDPSRMEGDLTCTNQHFLTFPAWYRGIVNSDCSIKSPAAPEFGGFSGFIWRIGLNIVEIILNAVGYAAVGFIIYGGYKYMISAGSPEGMVAARKTIMNASIGLVISIAAVAIVNTIAECFLRKYFYESVYCTSTTKN